MTKGRLEAFSDGVLAVIITIMVLELWPPHGTELKDVIDLGPKRVSGRVMWANLHLLFWLSLVPLCTAWVGAPRFFISLVLADRGSSRSTPISATRLSR